MGIDADHSAEMSAETQRAAWVAHFAALIRTAPDRECARYVLDAAGEWAYGDALAFTLGDYDALGVALEETFDA